MVNHQKINLVIFKIFFVLFLLTSCTITRSEKSIKLIDKNINNVQEQVKEVKKTTNKIKQEVKIIKQNQPECNLNNIEYEIEILDIQINQIDNSLYNLKGQVGVVNDVVKMEVKEYKSKYHKCIFYIITLIALFSLIIFNKIKINTSNIVNCIKNIYTWFKK